MIQKTLRRSIAVSAMGIAAGLVAPFASAASFVEIKLHDVLDLDSESRTYLQPVQAGARNGLPYETELKVEWWEWDNGQQRAHINTDCSFSIGVDADGNLLNPNNAVYEAESDGHTFRLQSGCNPSKVNQENSFLRVYPTENSLLTRPVMVMEAIVDSGSNKKKAGPFKFAMESERGSTNPWSLTDACEVREFASNFDRETNTYSGNEFDA